MRYTQRLKGVGHDPNLATEEWWEHRLGIAEWEPSPMTICIAAACDEGRVLVLASDTEVGIGLTATTLSDSKWGSLYRNWSVGIAGTVTHATEALRRMQEIEPQSLATIDVKDALERGYRQARLARVEAEYLATRGWTLQEFKEHGRAKLPETTYATIDARLALYDFGAELIAAGFPEDTDFPAILTVKNPGVSLDHSRLGFWCIGSGATAAQMSLFSRNYNYMATPEQATYFVLEAKIAAEQATGVGQESTIYLMRRNRSDPILMSEATENMMMQIWHELRVRKFEKHHLDALSETEEFKSVRRKEPPKRKSSTATE